MHFCFQLSPHANIRYREAQLSLGKAELQCLLTGLGLSCPVESESIGGVTFPGSFQRTQNGRSNLILII